MGSSIGQINKVLIIFKKGKETGLLAYVLVFGDLRFVTYSRMLCCCKSIGIISIVYSQKQYISFRNTSPNLGVFAY